MLGLKDDKPKIIKEKLLKKYHELKIFRLWSHSYLSDDQGFISNSIKDIVKDKELLEVIVSKELNPLLNRLINGKIEKDLFDFELSDIIKRYSIREIKGSILDELYNKLKTEKYPSFLEDFSILYETHNNKINLELEQKISNDISRLKYIINRQGINLEFFDTKVYTGQYPKAFSELVQHINILSSKVDHFNMGGDTKPYLSAINYLSKFFDNPQDFESKIKGCINLSKNKLELQKELKNYKLKMNGKVVNYETLFREILNKLENTVKESSQFIIESAN
jgi:hypothetical protein